MHTWKWKQGKNGTSGFRATGLHLLKRNIFENFDSDAAKEEQIPCAGALLSRKESATQLSLTLCFQF
jgi:hypothetical protein